jgi:hypothetical protein
MTVQSSKPRFRLLDTDIPDLPATGQIMATIEYQPSGLLIHFVDEDSNYRGADFEIMAPRERILGVEIRSLDSRRGSIMRLILSDPEGVVDRFVAEFEAVHNYYMKSLMKCVEETYGITPKVTHPTE